MPRHNVAIRNIGQAPFVTGQSATFWQHAAMDTPREYLEAVIGRTKRLRKAANLTQEEMSERLGIQRNTYVHYERAAAKRLTILPIHLAPRFCEIVGVSLEYFLTGREHPIVAAYNAVRGENKLIVDKFLGLDAHDPLDPPLHPGVDKTLKQPQR